MPGQSALNKTTPRKPLTATFTAAAPAPALRAWRTALGGRAWGPADIVLFSDSVGEGQGASVRSRRWADQMVANLRNRYPSGVTGGVGYVPACNYQNTYTSDWTLTGGAKTAYGLGERSVSLTASGHQVTTTQTCTSFKLYYLQGAANTGPFTVSIDGGAATTVTPPTTGGYSVAVWTSPALTAGSHTVTLAYGGSQTAFFLGGFFFNGDEAAGIRLIDAAHYGYTTSQYATDFPNSNSPGNNFGVGNYMALPWPPGLVIWTLGLNDYQSGTSPATVQSRAQTVFSAIKSIHNSKGWQAPSFLLLGMYQRTDVTTPAYPWSQYLAAYQAVAAADPANVTFLSLADRIDTTTQAYGTMQADGVHPTDKGHGFIADVMTAALLAA